MTEKILNAWKERFSRDIGIKDSVILYGNVFDICKNNLNQNKYESILENVYSLVREKGYKKIHVWDSVEGESPTLGDRVSGPAEISAASNSYLDANDSSFADPPSNSGAPVDVDNFFSQMLKTLSTETGTAFILNFSDYLFGNSNALSAQERLYLEKIYKTLQMQRYNVDSDYFLSTTRNLIVIIAKNQSSIPPIFYLENSQVSSINVPYPGRPERADFVDSEIDILRVSKSLKDKENKIIKDNFIDSLDGFNLKEIAQLIRLSRQNKDELSCEKLVNLYKYGEKISPWEELSKEKLETIEETLKKRVQGQDEAIGKVKSVILRAYTGFSGLQHSTKQRKPKGTLFFVGPTGVGKTELAKSIAEFIFGDENACIRFDMSEFSQEHSDQRLIGAPPGYVGYEAGGQLTNAVMAKPFCVLLFDEIEKAHGRILDKFLQILEDGRLTDSKGQTVYFSETIIIFTSNIGASNGEISPDMDKKIVRQAFINEVKNHFVNTLKRPELLNRIGDNIVPFNFINDKFVFVKIAKGKFRPIVEFMKERYQCTLKFENEEQIFESIAAQTDARNGGRGLLNIIESSIVNKLSDFVFEHSDEMQGRVIVVSKINPNVNRFNIDFG
jgi:energy-coupling factor transporter ATP-binding protein EcfA2